MSVASYLKRYEGIDGGDFVIWMAWSTFIGKFIDERKIAPVASEHLPYHDEGPTPQPMAEQRSEAQDLRFIRPRPFPGGLKIAHFHYKGEIYLLTESQWQEFTSKAMGMVQEKIQKAETITYQPLMELTQTALAI